MVIIAPKIMVEGIPARLFINGFIMIWHTLSFKKIQFKTQSVTPSRKSMIMIMRKLVLIAVKK